jgi:hypothetical protein
MDKESNWPPEPIASCHVFMRQYWPNQEIVDRPWKVSPMERVN